MLFKNLLIFKRNFQISNLSPRDKPGAKISKQKEFNFFLKAKKLRS